MTEVPGRGSAGEKSGQNEYQHMRKLMQDYLRESPKPPVPQRPRSVTPPRLEAPRTPTGTNPRDMLRQYLAQPAEPPRRERPQPVPPRRPEQRPQPVRRTAPERVPQLPVRAEAVPRTLPLPERRSDKKTKEKAKKIKKATKGKHLSRVLFSTLASVLGLFSTGAVGDQFVNQGRMSDALIQSYERALRIARPESVDVRLLPPAIQHELTNEDVANALLDPTQAARDVMLGHEPLSIMEALRVRAIRIDDENVYYATSVPIVFEAPDGTEVATFRGNWMDNSRPVPQMMLDILGVSEDAVADPGELREKLVKAGYYKLRYDVSRGGTTIAGQALKIGPAGTADGSVNPLNPMIQPTIFDPSRYSVMYLHQLLGWDRDGKVPNSFPDNPSADVPESTHHYVAMAAANAEEELWSDRLVHQQGLDQVLQFYAQSVYMGNFEGRERNGLPQAYMDWFGEPIPDGGLDTLTDDDLARMLILSATIPNPGYFTNPPDVSTAMRELKDAALINLNREGNGAVALGVIPVERQQAVADAIERVPLAPPDSLNPQTQAEQQRLAEIQATNPAQFETMLNFAVQPVDQLARFLQESRFVRYENGAFHVVIDNDKIPVHEHDVDLRQLIENGMTRQEKDGFAWYEMNEATASITPGETRTIPDFVGEAGLSVAVYDPQTEQIVGEYRGTQIMEPGSMIKPFIIYALMREGKWDMNGTVVDAAGSYGLAKTDFVAKNASRDRGTIRADEVLPFSRNTAIMAGVVDFIYEGIPRTSDENGWIWPTLNEQQQQIVLDRWNRLQDHMRGFGFEFTYVDGSPVDNPFAPGPTGLNAIAIGTGVFIRSTTEGESAQAALAKGYSMFFEDNSGAVDGEIMDQIRDNLGDEGDKIRQSRVGWVFDERGTELLGRDGTVSKTGHVVGEGINGEGQLVAGSTALGSMSMVRGADGRMMIAVSYMRGGAPDASGIVRPTALDGTAVKTDSTADALPFSLAAAEQALRWGGSDTLLFSSAGVPLPESQLQENLDASDSSSEEEQAGRAGSLPQ